MKGRPKPKEEPEREKENRHRPPERKLQLWQVVVGVNSRAEKGEGETDEHNADVVQRALEEVLNGLSVHYRSGTAGPAIQSILLSVTVIEGTQCTPSSERS